MNKSNNYQFLMNGKLGTTVKLDNKEYLYFGGAGYYMLQSHPDVINAAKNVLEKFGIGPATSRTITGTTDLLLTLEKLLADFFNTEDAVYLPSGYLSNIAGFQALDEMNLFDVIFIDENSHYCISDGAMTIGKKIVKFKHSDADDLNDKIRKTLKNGEKPLIASDGLFPVWGDVPPIDKYLETAENYGGIVWTDDSHAVGILGENGRGISDYFSINSDRLYMGATLSKAFGAYGGIVVGDFDFIKKIKQGKVMKGSSSPPNASVAAAIEGIKLLKNNIEWRKNLHENAFYLKNKLAKLGIDIKPNIIPIITFNLGNQDEMKRVQTELINEGIYIQFINYIGSGEGGVLRIVLNSFHTKEQIDFLIDRLYYSVKKL